MVIVDSHQAAALDDEDLALVAKIKVEDSHDRLMELFDQLNAQLFKKYCAKPYLTEPDPGVCVFAAAGTCGYLNVLRDVLEQEGINIVQRTR
jgi:hypothetical protein